MKILDEESEKVGEIQNANEKILAQRQKLYDENSGYNPASWFDSELNETLAVLIVNTFSLNSIFNFFAKSFAFSTPSSLSNFTAGILYEFFKPSRTETYP